MKHLHAATVITQAGRVVGVQVDASEGSAQGAPVARLGAGPGQQAHRIELEPPAKVTSAKAIERFHRAIERKIELLAEAPHSDASSSTRSERGTRKRRT
jgi:hypothetical protein